MSNLRQRFVQAVVQTVIVVILGVIGFTLWNYLFPYSPESERSGQLPESRKMTSLAEGWRTEWLSAMFDSPVREYLHGAGPFLFPASPDGFVRIRTFVKAEKDAVAGWKSELARYEAAHNDPLYYFAHNVEEAKWLIEGREKEIRNLEAVVDLLESQPGKWRKGQQRIEFNDDDLERKFAVCERAIRRLMDTYLLMTPCR